ncbi:hypothetical protein CBM2587_A160166 [Cupriavidus taiwanensis]|uniref:Uncharacterized protein n=1 Tax=Cupriavidus taiwanensis TaxID=164546 RepID=A0A375BJ10_9BURK|nr:hypothetical protein CBM2587_A160166 [Cupriavidus taiwanensis]
MTPSTRSRASSTAPRTSGTLARNARQAHARRVHLRVWIVVGSTIKGILLTPANNREVDNYDVNHRSRRGICGALFHIIN